MTKTLDPRLDRTTSARLDGATSAIGVLGGVVEVLNFLVPLWAGTALGLRGIEIGLLLAVDLAVAFAARYPMGHLADRVERSVLAAAGAGLMAVSLGLYALALDVRGALAAAVVGGVAGAVFRVPAMAIVGEAALRSENAFVRATSSEATGVWCSYVVAISLLPRIDYPGVFLLGAAACLAAAVGVARVPRHPAAGRDPVSQASTPPPSPLRHATLRPMLVVLVVVAAVETAASLVVLLRLQHDLGLPMSGIILVFVPGLIAYSVCAPLAARAARAVGRAGALAGACVLSMVAVAGLMMSTTTITLTVFWVFTCVAWAVASPVATSAVTHLTPGALGRGLGVYEAAQLLGAAIGSLVGGAVADSSSHLPYAVGGAAVMLGCAGSAWRILRGSEADVVREQTHPEAADTTEDHEGDLAEDVRPARRPNRIWLVAHGAVFLVAQVALAVAGLSFVAHVVQHGWSIPDLSSLSTTSRNLYQGGVAWFFVIALDFGGAAFQEASWRLSRPAPQGRVREEAPSSHADRTTSMC